MDQRTTILTLLHQMCGHIGKTHWTISMRIFGKGDFFKGILSGGDCRTMTAARVIQWFADNWPADLAWPDHITRPDPSAKTAGRAA